MISNQAAACFLHIEVAMCVILTYANFCQIFTSLTLDINKNLVALSESAQISSGKSMAKRNAKNAKDLNEIIQFHADAQQFGSTFNVISIGF